MKIGKISDTVLNRSILRPLRQAGAAGDSAVFGEDCAVFAPGSESFPAKMACSTVTGTVGGPFDRTMEMLFSQVLLNLYAAGARCRHLFLDFLLPEGQEEEKLKKQMEQAAKLCRRYEIKAEGGHTEVSRAVSRTVITLTGLGVPEPGEKGAVPKRESLSRGMELVMAGWTGAAGTAVLASDMRDELLERYPEALLEAAVEMGNPDRILEAARARNHFGVSAMHDVSQGGVFAALWEMAERAGAGLEVDLKKIPIRQETIEICEYFDLNPYQLFGQGALLIAAERGAELTEKLGRLSVEAAVIGRFTGERRRIIRNGEEIRYLDRPAQDELWRLAEEREAAGRI